MKSPRSIFASLALAACADTTLHRAAPPGDRGPPEAPPTPPEHLSADGAELDGGAWFAERRADDRHAADPPDTRADSPAWEAFYAPDAVHTVDLELSEEAFDALEDDGRTWVPARVTIDGVVFEGAGVRRKGSTTWRSLHEKPSFKIKLEAFGAGPRLAGLERVTLNNMVSDPSQARENVALQLWRALGAEATRASWAVVTLGGEPYGLYSNIEPLDDVWLARRYRSPGGDLWEANDDADFTEDGLLWWELAEGDGASGTLEAVTAALDAGVEDVEAELGAYVDVEQFLRYWATCLATGAADGYPFHLNDAYVYADPDDGGRLDFLPWGMDEAWGENFSPWPEGALAQACEDDPACDARRREVLDEVLAELDAIDVIGIAEASFATSAPLVADDPRRPFTDAEVAAARAELVARLSAWPARVRSEAP